MKKKRLLIVNDASWIPSGYGVYGKELLTRLHNSGKYEVAELGCYAKEDDPRIKDIPWTFYPNIPLPESTKELEAYRAQAISQFGSYRFNKCALDFKPDIVFDIRDYWMSAYQEYSPYRRFFKWVILPTVDSAPQNLEWYFTFRNADVVVPYTEWARKVLEEGGNGSINLFPKVANAGINPNQFFPIEDKKSHKKEYLGSSDLEVIGCVMRNQKRKLIPDILYSFRKYLDRIVGTKKYNNTILYLHTSYPEENGWKLPELLVEHGVADKVFFSYSCKQCGKFFASRYNGSVQGCKICNTPNSAMFCSVSNGLPTEDLNKVYNLFDVFIQYAICEGFGMPQVEAGACGLHVASCDYSAMSEIVRYLHGTPIPVQRMFRELETGADRCYPDNNFLIDFLYRFFNEYSDEEKSENSKKIRQSCIDRYSWDSVYKVWDECFSRVDITDKPDWTTTEQFLTNHSEMKVPGGLSPKDFVKYVCMNIINEPYLFNTAIVQQTIRDIQHKVIARGGHVKTFSYKDAIESLEQHLNNKIVHEQYRLNESNIKKESFLTCHKKN